MSQLSHAQFPLRRPPNLLVDHRRSRSAAVAEPRGANGEAVTDPGGRLQIGMVAGIKSERWPASNRNPRPDCVGIRKPAAPRRACHHSVPRDDVRAKPLPIDQRSAIGTDSSATLPSRVDDRPPQGRKRTIMARYVFGDELKPGERWKSNAPLYRRGTCICLKRPSGMRREEMERVARRAAPIPPYYELLRPKPGRRSISRRRASAAPPCRS